MRFSKVLFILLVILSFTTRIAYLNGYPEGFHKDKASVGYNAYSIIKTAKDEYGMCDWDINHTAKATL